MSDIVFTVLNVALSLFEPLFELSTVTMNCFKFYGHAQVVVGKRVVQVSICAS